MEIARQHADDGRGISVQGHALAEDIPAPAESPLPCGVAQERGPWLVLLLVARLQVAAENRGNAEGAKEAGADARTVSLLRSGRRLQDESKGRIDVERREDCVLGLPIEVIEIREVETRTERDAFIEDGEARGI